jgi:ABC-type transport system substrate-binding protein
MRARIWSWLIAVGIGLLWVGPVGAAGSLVAAQGTDVTSLDPGDGGDVPSVIVHMNLYDTLIRPKWGGGGYAPGLATSWKAAADGRTWTLALRKGVKFHDGTSFDAEAVKVNIDRLIDTKDKLRYGRYFAAIIERAEVVDPLTVRIVTRFPTLLLENRLALEWAGMVSPAALKKHGKGIRQNPVGTGPYKFKEWLPGDHVTLARNDDYWGGKPALDAVTFRPVKEPSTRVVMVETGQAPVALDVPAAEVVRLRAAKGVEVRVDPGQRIVFMAFNTKLRPFDDVRVRQALNHAVDKQAIVQHVLGGYAEVMDSPLAPAIWGYHKVRSYPYDVARAKQLLAAAGYANGFETALYMTPGRYFMDKEFAQAVQAQLGAVGVRMRIVNVDWGAHLSSLTRAGEQVIAATGEPVPMYVLGWSGATSDAEIIVNALLADEGFPPNGYNAGRFSHSEVNDLAKRANRTVDVEERARLYRRAQEILVGEAPWLFLHVEKQITAVRDNVEGVRVWPNTRVDLTGARLK